MKKNIYIILSTLVVVLLIVIFYRVNLDDQATSKYRTATLPKDYVFYNARINSKYLYCGIRINEVDLLENSRTILGVSQGEVSFNEFITNGENDIAIDIAPWGIFDDEDNYSEVEKSQYPVFLFSKERFADGAFCEVTITASTFEGRKRDERTVAVLKLEIDEKGQPMIAKVNQEYDYPASPFESLKLSSIQRKDIVETNQVYNLSRILNAKGLPHWVWVDTPEYKDIPNNRELLEEAYYELWQAFNTRNEKKLRELLDISMYEFARGNSSLDVIDEEDIQAIYENFTYDDIFSRIRSMNAFDASKFQVFEYLNGRVVRLANKSDQPPISYEAKSGKEGFMNHYMSFIDGKFRVVR